MCPDLQTLSTYLDGELPSQWMRRVEDHILDCSSCRSRLSRLEFLRQELKKGLNPDHRPSEDRVWSRLSRSIRAQPVSIFRRSVAVPVAWLAVAALVVVLLGASLVFSLTGSSMRMMRIVTEPTGVMEVQVSAPIEDLELLLKSLEKHEATKETIIQLPENSQFLILGEPVLLRAKDLSWRTSR